MSGYEKVCMALLLFVLIAAWAAARVAAAVIVGAFSAMAAMP